MLKNKKSLFGAILTAVMAICFAFGLTGISETKNVYANGYYLGDVLRETDFPISGNDFYDECWIAENGYLCYYDDYYDDFVLYGENNEWVNLTTDTELTKEGDNYKYTNPTFYSITFTMEEEVLKNVTVTSLSSMCDNIKGTYKPVVAYNCTTQTPYDTLASAVEEAEEGDEIELWADENSEDIVLPSGIKLYTKQNDGENCYTGNITAKETGKTVCQQFNWGSYTIFATTEYPIIYKDMGGGDFSGTHEEGYPATYVEELPLFLKDATKEGYYFRGWYTDSDCTGEPVSYIYAYSYFEYMDGDDLIFYAKWDLAKITKPSADTKNFVYNGEPQTYLIAQNDKYTISDNTTQTNVGKYQITVSIIDKETYAWEDGTTEDLIFDFVINQKVEDVKIKNPSGEEISDPKVKIVSAENGIAPEAVFVVEVIEVGESNDTTPVKQTLLDSDKISKRQKIYGVYDAKLLVGIDEVQPNGNITIKMFVPEELCGKTFKLFHIHGENEVYEINYTDVDENGYITFETDKLSQFAFVDVGGLSALAITLIVLGAVLFLVIVLYVLGYFFLYRKGKLDKTAIKAIYKFLPMENKKSDE